MFKFLKKLFATEEEKTIIAQNQVQKWLIQEFERTDQELTSQFAGALQKIKETLAKMEKGCKELENATLANPNIPTRELQLMKGNRHAYLDKTRKFIADVKEHMSMNFFLNEYEERLQQFSVVTTRPYRILQHFFADEIAVIASGIREINKTLGAFIKSPTREKHKKLDELKKKSDEIGTTIAAKHALSEELTTLDKDVQKAKQLLETSEKEKEQFLTSSAYKEWRQLELQESQLAQRRKRIENTIHTEFSSIGRAMRKYRKVSLDHDKLLDSYVNDPANALKEDEALVIVNALHQMHGRIEQGKLVLKQPEKISKQIQRLTRDYLTSFKNEFASMKKEKTELLRSQENNTAEEQLAVHEKAIKKAQSTLQEREQELAAVKEELASFDARALRNHLFKEIESQMSIQIGEKTI